MSVEFWTTGLGLPSEVARQAAEAEGRGWDGFAIPYAPTMAPDPYACLVAAAGATSRILLGTWVATPASHTPASQAGSIRTVQAESGGRAVLALGRGDSAHAYVGMAPAPVAFFERYVSRLRKYLQGEPQPFDLDLDGGGHFPPVDRLGLAQAPEVAQFGLSMQDIPPVPLDIVATGPKVIGIAARHADRVSFGVGAEPGRVEWALGEARRAREAAGVNRRVSYGAWIPLAVTDDATEGRRMLSGVVASMARFTAMHGQAVAPVSSADRRVYEDIHDAYEMQGHFREGSPQSRKLNEEFTDRFALIAPADECVKRLRELIDLGIDRFIISSATPDLCAEKVLPALR